MEDAYLYIPRRSQRSQRIDYHLLNNGSDDEAPPEDRIFKRPHLNKPKESPEPITPDDSVSQFNENQSASIESIPQNEFSE